MLRYIADFRLGIAGLAYAEIDASSDRDAFDQALGTNSFQSDRRMLRIVRHDGAGEVVVWRSYFGSHTHQLNLAVSELWEHGRDAAKPTSDAELAADGAALNLCSTRA